MTHEFEIVWDCVDPTRLGTFWAVALGYTEDDVPEGYESWAQYDRQHGVEPNIGWGCYDPQGKRPNLFFQRVPEPKTVKNRLHLDVRVPDMDAEVARLVSLGATTLQVVQKGPDERWTVMSDPEGNEFCVMKADG